MQRAFTAPPAAFLSVSKQLSWFLLLSSHARCSSVNMLLKLMWNDSNSSHPSKHPHSCQRCIVLYDHPILSSPIFVPPSAPVHSKRPFCCLVFYLSLHLLFSLFLHTWLFDMHMICWQTAAPGCATTTGGASSIRTSGTASASQDGEDWDVM